MSTVIANAWKNSDGTENYKCRAWVNFNGTGTVAIRAAGNVSSITDNGTGDYTVNFTNAMPDTYYAVSLSSVTFSSVNNTVVPQIYGSSTAGANLKTTSAIRFGYYDRNELDYSGYDCAEMNISVFR